MKVPEPSSGSAKTSDFDPGGYTSLSLHGGGTSRRIRERYPESDLIPYTEVKTSRKDTKFKGTGAAISPCGAWGADLASGSGPGLGSPRALCALFLLHRRLERAPPRSVVHRRHPSWSIAVRRHSPPSVAAPEDMQRLGLVRVRLLTSFLGLVFAKSYSKPLDLSKTERVCASWYRGGQLAKVGPGFPSLLLLVELVFCLFREENWVGKRQMLCFRFAFGLPFGPRELLKEKLETLTGETAERLFQHMIRDQINVL
ncbi:hypothetical protein V6N13_137775 [Hibiscus sabdariffa]